MQSTLLFLLFIAPFTGALLNGVERDWDLHAYLVKILARSSEESSPIACSGTLISPRLVLTSADCAMNHGKRMSDILVSVTRAGHRLALRKRAEMVEVTGSAAVLRLQHAIPMLELCPSPLAARRLSFLSISPSLTRSSIVPFEWDQIDVTTCRMVGFTSSDEPTSFISSRNVSKFDLKVEDKGDNLQFVRANQKTPTACYEDPGAPFECVVGEDFVQVGIFTSLRTTDDGSDVHHDEDHDDHNDHDHDHDDEHESETSTKRSKRDAPEVTSPSSTSSPSKTSTDAVKLPAKPTATTQRPLMRAAADEKTVPAAKKPTSTKNTEMPRKAKPEVMKNTIVMPTLSRCLSSSSLIFAKIDATVIGNIIEKYDFAGLVKYHELCKPLVMGSTVAPLQ